MSLLEATLTISNNTGCTLTQTSSSADQGGFDGDGPASSIAPGGSSTFKVQQSNHAGHGPQGTAAYTMDSGNATYPVNFTWDYSSGNSHEYSYTVSGPDGYSWSSSSGSGSSSGMSVTYPVSYTPHALNDWDMVLALSQGLINSTLSASFGHKTSFKAPTDPSMDTSGTTWLGLDVARMDTPKINILQGGGTSVELWLWFTSATLYYQDGGIRKSLPMSSVQVVLTVNLASAATTDAESFAALDPATRAQLQGLADQRFTVWSIYLDLRNPKLTTGMRVLDSKGNPLSWSTAETSTLAQALSTWGAHTPPPPLAALAKPTSSTPPSAPLLAPTDFQYGTTWCSETDPSTGKSSTDASTLNVMTMTRSRKEPTVSSRASFSAPVAGDSTSGRIMIANDAFDGCYLASDLMPQLFNALVAGLDSVKQDEAVLVSSSYASTTDPLVAMSSLVKTELSAALSALGSPTNTYVFEAVRDNSNLNGGLGAKTVLNNAVDSYCYLETTLVCVLGIVESAAGIVLKGQGQVQQYGSTKQYPFGTNIFSGISISDAEARYQQLFDVTVTIGPANSGGGLVIDASLVPGAFTTLEEDAGFLESYADFMNAHILGDTSSPTTALASQISGVATSVTTALNQSVPGALDVISTVVVLPGGPNIYYSNASSQSGQVAMTVKYQS
jgi:hypothetical protein